MNELVLATLRVGVIAYAGLCTLLLLGQSRFVYHPERLVEATPADVQVAFEAVTLETGDGEKLDAWYVPPDPDRDRGIAICFCHGNAGNLGRRVGAVMAFRSMGFHTLAFDYRGYGKSTGRPSERGTYRDAAAAWKYLVGKRGFAAERIVVFGRSLGGAVATHLATDVAPGALVIESGFTSAPAMAERMFRFLPVRLLCRFRYDSLSRMPALKCPVLIAHGRQDNTVPFEMGKQLYDAARGPKTFVELAGGHNGGGLETNASYRRAFQAFVDRHLSQ